MSEAINGRTNVGYEITDSVHVQDREFVLAYDQGKSSPYVTWECVNGKDYYFGHYFSNKLNAQRDLINRANEVMLHLEQMRSSADRGGR